LAAAFSCGDDDLDDFIRSDALRYQALRVARTYLAFEDARLVGYLTVAADAVQLTSGERKKIHSDNAGALGHEYHGSVPALKLARLGVCREYRSECVGCGRQLVKFCAWLVFQNAKTFGCRLLTVDAYPDAVGFYEKLGFQRNSDKLYRERSHPSMRFDVFAKKVADWVFE
jgi:GNAT superfamily N-acetyltransferase